jgi:hypothetical protein
MSPFDWMKLAAAIHILYRTGRRRRRRFIFGGWLGAGFFITLSFFLACLWF